MVSDKWHLHDIDEEISSIDYTFSKNIDQTQNRTDKTPNSISLTFQWGTKRLPNISQTILHN